MKSFNILKLPIFLILCVFLTISCSEKGSDKPSSADAFVTAKEAYNDGLYEIAIQKLSAYKSKYPYSKFAVEADLLIADCHYQLGNYEEAAISYKHFIRLHPKHPKPGLCEVQRFLILLKKNPAKNLLVHLCTQACLR